MSIQLVFFNALGLLEPALEREVRAGVETGIAAFERHHKVENLGVAIHPNGQVSEFTGLGGINYGPESFAIFADDSYEGLRKDTRRGAAAVTVHELHHAMRTRHYLPRRLYGSSDLCAGEILVMEGLAIRTEYFLGFGPSLLVHEVDPLIVDGLIDRVAPIVSNPTSDWGWIYDLNGLPPHVYKAMYPMGYTIVGDFLRRSNLDPIAALGVPWQEFWETFRQGHSDGPV